MPFLYEPLREVQYRIKLFCSSCMLAFAYNVSECFAGGRR